MPRHPETDRATIHDVSRIAGVSVMSVSRAMRGVEGVSEETRNRILRIARELHYTPNSNARALARTEADLIGISLPTLFNDVFADVLLGMRRVLDAQGYSVVVDTTNYSTQSERSFVDRLLQWRPGALVLTGSRHDAGLRQMIEAAGVRALEIWDVTDTPIDICVGIDHRAAGYDLGREMVALGYRSPAFIGLAEGRDPRADLRAEGLAQAFAEVGGRGLKRIGAEASNSFVMGAEGYSAIDQSDHPDVLFFLNDHIAFGGLCRAEQMGKSVPEDFGIVGFNSLDLTKVLPRQLTTMATPRRDIGLIGARNLIAALNGVEVAPTTTLPCKFIPGQTTRPSGSGA